MTHPFTWLAVHEALAEGLGRTRPNALRCCVSQASCCKRPSGTEWEAHFASAGKTKTKIADSFVRSVDRNRCKLFEDLPLEKQKKLAQRVCDAFPKARLTIPQAAKGNT